METTIPQHPRGWTYCQQCKRGVNRAKDAQGSVVVVERCALGSGDVSLTRPLFEGEPLLASPVRRGTSHYRIHRCIKVAHSAANFSRKSAPEMSDKKYSAISGGSPLPKGRKCPP